MSNLKNLKLKRRTAIASALSAGVFGLVACSNDNQASTSGTSDAGGAEPATTTEAGPLDQVTVNTEFGVEPEIEFESPLTIDGVYAKAHNAGDGEAFEAGEVMLTRSAFFNAEDGTLLGSQWQDGGSDSLTLSTDVLGQEAYDFLINLTVGTRFLMAAAIQGMQVIQVADVIGKPLTRAEGEAVELPDTVPAFILEADGAPVLDGEITQPAPTELIAVPSIEGAGAEAKSGDTLIMHYRGWDWATGEEFDSSWGRGEPFTFQLGAGQVIQGWDQGLQGFTAGSQVVLGIPAALAYGAEPSDSHQLAGKDLLFVADVLAVVSATA